MIRPGTIIVYMHTVKEAIKHDLSLLPGGCVHTLYVEGRDQSRKFCSVVVQNLLGKKIFVFCAIMNNILPQGLSTAC